MTRERRWQDDGRTLADFLPQPAAPAVQAARAGSALPPGVPPATREAIVAALREVHDPEIPVNIYELGLIYDLRTDAAGTVDITMTLTAPACPVAGEIPGQVAQVVARWQTLLRIV